MTAYTVNGTSTASRPDILSWLDGVRPTGNGWKAKCPAHDDQHPSLSIDVGEDSRTLVHCFAGCTAEEVVRAIGMTMENLMPGANGHRKSNSESAGTIVATYDYRPLTARWSIRSFGKLPRVSTSAGPILPAAGSTTWKASNECSFVCRN